MNEVSPTMLSGQTIYIAAAAPLSGLSGPLGKELIQAVTLAVEEQNNAGGIYGAPVHLYTEDDEGQEQKGETIARAFSNEPTILGVVGHYNSDVTLAALEVYDEAALPLVAPVASNPLLTESGFRHIFRLTNRDDHTGAAIAQYLLTEKQKRKAILIWSATAYGESMARSFTKFFMASGGKIVYQKSIPEGTNDFASIFKQFPKEHDLLFYGGYFEGALLLLAYRQAGYTQLFAAGDGCWDVIDFLDRVGEKGEAGEGVLILSATPEPGKVQGSEAFQERYTQRFGRILNYAVNSYDSARVLMAAIRNAAAAEGQLPTRLAVSAALREIEFQGICYEQPVRYNEKGDNVHAVTALHVIRNGQYHQITTTPVSKTQE